MPIDDAGGSITVDGTVTANAGTGTFTVDGSGVTQPVSGTVTETNSTAILADTANMDTNLATVAGAVHNEDSVHTTADPGVQVLGVRQDTQADFGADGDYVPMSIDANGAVRVNAINADGTSNVDTAAGATDAGAVMLAVRDDSLTTLTPIDGDYAHLRVSSTGALHVTGGGGGTEYTVNAAAPADPTGTASLMERDDALSALTEIEGDWSNMRCNANGALWTTVDGTVTVDGSAVTQPVSGTVTANLGATDNAVLDQIEVNTSYGDNTGNGTAAGSLRVTLASDSTGVVSVDDNGGSLTIDGTVTANAGTGTMTVDLGANNDVQGQVAHDAAVSGNPLIAGARATNSVEGITQVANGDATRLQADLNGVLLSRPHTTPEEHISERISNTNGTSTDLTNFAAAGAGIHNYVTDVTITNTSATDAYVDLRDGAAGSVIWTFPAPANSGATHSFSLPLKGAANTALAYDVSAAITTMYISINGFSAQG